MDKVRKPSNSEEYILQFVVRLISCSTCLKEAGKVIG
jgi:hypothetical protein